MKRPPERVTLEGLVGGTTREPNDQRISDGSEKHDRKSNHIEVGNDHKGSTKGTTRHAEMGRKSRTKTIRKASQYRKNLPPEWGKLKEPEKQTRATELEKQSHQEAEAKVQMSRETLTAL